MQILEQLFAKLTQLRATSYKLEQLTKAFVYLFRMFG